MGGGCEKGGGEGSETGSVTGKEGKHKSTTGVVLALPRTSGIKRRATVVLYLSTC